MTKSWICSTVLLVTFAAEGFAAHAQTDVAASLYGAFSGLTNSNGTVSPSNAAGGLLEVRHIKNPLVGFEATYSYNRSNQSDSSLVVVPCPPVSTSCGSTATQAAISANAHEFTGDWLASVKISNLRPFALAGGGVLVDVPTSGSVPTTTVFCESGSTTCTTTTTSTPTGTETKAVFVYGAGVDWGLLPHLGLRLQYRDNLYKMPALLNTFTSVNAFTNTAEPTIGVYFRF